MINEFPVRNSKSFKPRWWDTVPHPEREADSKLQCFWSLMIAHCSITSSDGWGTVWVAFHISTPLLPAAGHPNAMRHVYLHLSSTCMATQGGAVSPFFSVCIQLFLDYKERNWLIRFFLLNETSAQTPFKELSMTTSSPYVLEAYFCGCRCSCCYNSCHLKAKSMSLYDCLTQTH